MDLDPGGHIELCAEIVSTFFSNSKQLVFTLVLFLFGLVFKVGEWYQYRLMAIGTHDPLGEGKKRALALADFWCHGLLVYLFPTFGQHVKFQSPTLCPLFLLAFVPSNHSIVNQNIVSYHTHV